MKETPRKLAENEISQSMLDGVYEEFVDSVIEDGNSLVINFINNDEVYGVSEEHYVISKEIIPRISNIVNSWNSDFTSLIETLMRTIKVQVVADGNMVAQGRDYNLRVFFVDKLMHEPQGTIRFRLALIESKDFNYFNHEVIDEPESEHIDDLLNQDEVSFLIESLINEKFIQDKKDTKKPTVIDTSEEADNSVSLLEIKTQECNILREKIGFLEEQIRLQDTMYQKLFTELEKYRKS